MVQILGCDFNQQTKLPIGASLILPLVQKALDLPLAVLDRTIIGCAFNRAVDGDHHGFFQQLVDSQMIEVSPVVYETG